MRKIVVIGLCSIALCGALSGCSRHRFERKVVFGGPAETRLDRVREYSLEDQYKIFRYGNDVVEPPLLNLAKPIAERGASAVPFLLKQLNSKSDDEVMLTRDILLVFEEMALSKSYNVKTDALVMNTLTTKIATIKDKGWQDTCLKMLKRIDQA